jgi:O-antigen/teichoic acid export membrane protein
MPETLKEKTAKGLFWGGLSSTVQQLLGIVFGIILARRLNQSDFGMIAMITIFQLIGNDLQNSGFKVALVNLRQPTDRDYNSVFWFNILMGGTLYVLLFFLAPLIANFYHIPSLTPLARYAFLSIVFASFGTAQSAWLFKNLHAKQQAKAGMMAVLISSSVAVVMAYMGFAYWALATQTNLYILLCTLLYWHYSPWRPTIRSSKSNVQNPSDDSIALSTPLNPSQPLSTGPQALSQPHRRCLSTFIEVLRPALRMFRFSVKLLISQVLTDINNNVLNILLGRFYGRHDTGNYNQAFQWSTKGSNIIQSMVQQVAQPVLVSIDNEHERQLHVLRKMMRFAAFLSFPLLFGLSLVSHEFIVTLLGEKWAQSAHYLRLLAVASAFLPLSTLLANVVITKGRSNIFMYVNLALAICQTAAMLTIYHFKVSCFEFLEPFSTLLNTSTSYLSTLNSQLLTMVLAFVALTILWFFVWAYFARRLAGYRFTMLLRDVLPFLLSAAAVMLTTSFISTCIIPSTLLGGVGGGLLLLIARILLAALLYYALMRLFRVQILNECLQFFNRRKSDKYE